MKTVFLAMASVAGLSATPAMSAERSSASPEVPIELWGGLTSATTKAEMRAFRDQLPDKRAQLYPGCLAQVLYRYKKERLVMVLLLGRNKDAPCSDILLRDHTAKLGAPIVTNTTQSSMPIVAGGIVLSHQFTRTDYTWQGQGREVLLAFMPGRPSGYNLMFTVLPDK